MRQTLQLRVSQHLVLTPQLQQSIRLLQLSTLELSQEIEQALQDNPLLELEDGRSEETSWTEGGGTVTNVAPEPEPESAAFPDAVPDGGSEENWPTTWDKSQGSAEGRDPNDDSGQDSREWQAAQTSLVDHLFAQIALSQWSERERMFARIVVEALEDNGYLVQTVEELADFLLAQGEIPMPEADAEGASQREALCDALTIAVCQVQSLDPSGIAARSPQECLLLQLRDLPASEVRALACVLVREHLPKLAQRDFAGLKRLLGCTDAALRAAQALILGLDPHPGNRFAPSDTRYIVPDVIVARVGAHWQARINPEVMPRLRINRMMADLLRGCQSDKGGNLSGQLQEARWLIKNVQQRFDTILRVAQAIVTRQQAFFTHGEVAMRPMVLRDIAEQLEMHESTISRVTTQKFLACARGTFELKYFFGSHVGTDTGGTASSTAIRALIRQLVAAETPHQPLTDARIAEILAAQGLQVARRTVAKYRESLNIPPVNLRKTL